VPTLEYAKEHLFGPLDIESVEWDILKDGYNDGAGFGLKMSSKDLIKIGQLVLDKGISGDIQIVPTDWINKSYNEGLKRDTKWGLRRSTHGYGWYSKMIQNEQILYSMGYGGQFIFVVPSDELVIVCTHNHDTANGLNQQIDFLSGTFSSILDQY